MNSVFELLKEGSKVERSSKNALMNSLIEKSDLDNLEKVISIIVSTHTPNNIEPIKASIKDGIQKIRDTKGLEYVDNFYSTTEDFKFRLDYRAIYLTPLARDHPDKYMQLLRNDPQEENPMAWQLNTDNLKELERSSPSFIQTLETMKSEGIKPAASLLERLTSSGTVREESKKAEEKSEKVEDKSKKATESTDVIRLRSLIEEADPEKLKMGIQEIFAANQKQIRRKPIERQALVDAISSLGFEDR